MKTKHIFIFFFSFLYLNSFAQEDQKIPKYKYEPNFLVGVDVLNLGISFFSNRKIYQGFVSSRIRKNLEAVADAGLETNTYQKNGYDASVSGPFIKLGAMYMVVADPEQENNGFFVGGKVAASFYTQQYRAVPVRGYSGSSSTVAFPKSSQSSYWIEGTAGGRVQLFDSNFYIDMNLQPRYLIASTKQDDIKPMIVPGFGKSSGKFNLGFMWNLAYRF